MESTTFSCRNAGNPAARLPWPATSGWPQQRLASPPQGAGQNAGGQGPKAAPPRAGEQASRGCPRVAQRGMAAWAAGSGCRLPLSAAAPVFVSLAWLRGLRDRARARPSAKGPQALKPQSPRPSGPSAQRGRGLYFLGRCWGASRAPAWWPNQDAPRRAEGVFLALAGVDATRSQLSPPL